MSTKREEAIQIIQEMIPGLIANVSDDPLKGQFASEFLELGLDNLFGSLWTRPGLSRRDRSLVTLGMLIALRASDELRIHFPAAIRNGLSEDEVAEVIYHATGYAGFPAASSARTIAQDVLRHNAIDEGPR